MDDNTRDIFTKIKATASVIGEAAGDVAKQAGKKVGESFESVRSNARVYEINNEISRLFAELGQLVYGAHIGNESAEETVDDVIAKIDAKTAELREAQAQAEERKKTLSCPVCAMPYAKDDKFCKECGTPLV